MFIVFLIFLLSFLQSSVYEGWKLLVAAYIIIGYSHFYLGYLYQKRSYEKRNDKKKVFYLFTLPNLLLLIPAFFLLTNSKTYPIFFLFIVAYFLFHGYCNEKTIFKRLSGIDAPRNLYLYTILILLVFAKSLTHPSITIDMFISEEILAATSLTQFLPDYFFYIYPIMIGITIFSFAYSLFTLREKAFKGLNKYVTGLFLPLFIIILLMPQIAFIHVLAFILIYHFLEWTFYSYGQIKKRKSKKDLREYNILTTITIGIFLGIFLLNYILGDNEIFSFVYQIVFATVTLLILTFFHITSSFFNENFIKKPLGLK